MINFRRRDKLSDVVKEVSTMSCLQHDNIVAFYKRGRERHCSS